MPLPAERQATAPLPQAISWLQHVSEKGFSEHRQVMGLEKLGDGTGLKGLERGAEAQSEGKRATPACLAAMTHCWIMQLQGHSALTPPSLPQFLPPSLPLSCHSLYPLSPSCPCRMVYLPMSYVYGRRATCHETELTRTLRWLREGVRNTSR